MKFIKKNLCRNKTDNYDVHSGDEFIECNLSRSIPHTKIFVGLTGLKFTKCNLLNCDIPVDATREGGLHIHKSICSHLHKNRLVAGEITECAESCFHVIDSDSITIDGVSLGTNYQYEDKVVS